VAELDCAAGWTGLPRADPERRGAPRASARWHTALGVSRSARGAEARAHLRGAGAWLGLRHVARPARGERARRGAADRLLGHRYAPGNRRIEERGGGSVGPRVG